MSDEQPDAPEFIVRVGHGSEAAEPLSDSPFCVAVLGDFSGRANRGVVEAGPELAGRQPLRVDRDNFDDVLARLAPHVQIAPFRGSESILSLRFAQLDDFHPDRLYERLPVFQSLREMRSRLEDPATAARAVDELRAAGPAAGHQTKPRSAPENLLEQILDESGPPPITQETISGDLGVYLRRIVAPHLIPELDPKGSELLAQVDDAVAQLMRALLHHPDVQSLEARWRAVDLLTRRIETNSQLQFYLIDVSTDELAADQRSDLEFEETGLYKLLVEGSVGTPGARRWAVLVGDYTFGPEPKDVELAARLAAIANLAGAPWISAAHPRVAGCESFHAAPDPADWVKEAHPAWAVLRELPLASWLGLAAPRFLLRLPYGAETEPCDLFPFEEMRGPPAHEAYLWGNPAFACALLLANSFAAAGWDLQPGMHQDIGGLPLHLYKDHQDGELVSKPCAEVLLTERAAARLIERGLMPLASMKGSDSVKLVRFQSIAHPSAPLAGSWMGAQTDE
jgi:type VI secretion system protein ImpC